MSDANQQDIQDRLQSRLRLREDLTFVPQTYSGRQYVHIEVSGTSQFFRIGYDEYLFISAFDGQTTLVEAITLSARTRGDQAIQQDQAISIFDWLIDNRLGSFVSAGGRIDSFDPQTSASKSAGGINPFYIRLPLLKPDRVLDAALPWTRWLFSKVCVLFCFLLWAVGGYSLISHWEEFSTQARMVFAPSSWALMIVNWLLLKIVHEFAHALACKRHGGDVKEMGVIFVLFAPLAYVDVTSSWRFKSRWKRIHVAFAGMFVEVTIASIALLVWPSMSPGMGSQFLHNLILMASVTTLLFNANPLMKFDGYYIFSDLIQFPNLYSDSMTAIRRLANLLFWGSGGAPSRLGTGQQCVATAYGLAAFCWRITVSVTLLIAASALAAGAGVVLAGFGIVLWVLMPLKSLAFEIYRRFHEQPISLLRASLVSAAIVAPVALLLLYVPSPFVAATPGVVEFRDLAVVRSDSPGFVERICVCDGQFVQSGDLLIRLSNPELAQQLEDLNSQLAMAERRRGIAIDEEKPALVQIEKANIESLQSRLRQQTKVVEGLGIRAPATGKIVARELEHLLGTYVEPGQELATIGSESNKEIVLSIDHKHVDEAHAVVGKEITLRIGSRPSTNGDLVRLEPQARVEIPHPALAASAGGPLIVKQATDDSSEAANQLVDPRFKAVVQVDQAVSANLLCGEKTYAYIRRNNHSLGTAVYETVADWLQRQYQLSKQSS